jgi:hypothetical protein
MKDEDELPNCEDQASGEHDEDEKEDDDDDDGKDGKKSRRELPAGAVATLKAWLLSPENFTHPYPTPQDQAMLVQKTGIDMKQLKYWFDNARRRIWKPMLKKQLEQGKIVQTAGGNVVLGGTSGLIASASTTNNLMSNGSGLPKGGTKVQSQNAAAAAQSTLPMYSNQYNAFLSQPSQQKQQQQVTTLDILAQSSSLGSLPLYSSTGGDSSNCLNKSDSHAVLMELFVRDQDLVRQYTEGMKLRAAAAVAAAAVANTIQPAQGVGVQSQLASQSQVQHPMTNAVKGGMGIANSKLGNAQSLNSWPHFSSVSSLNNLGSMTGVKSITNMSGADLAGLGSLNKKGNLAQVKSMESMVCLYYS